MLKVYPWQKNQWQQLQLSRQGARFHHALLLTGPNGIGLGHFARCLSASLVCANPGADLSQCGECKSCVLHKAGNHPDIRLIEPEEEGKQITVPVIRGLIDFINLKSQYGRYKLTIINPAETMNRHAANTLLKTLEEPPPDSLLMLLSHRPSLLPVTIRSRCQRIYFQPVYDEETLAWLRRQPGISQNAEQLLSMANGAPLAAQDLHESNCIEQQNMLLEDLEALQRKEGDPIMIAGRWNAMGANRVLHRLMQLISNMARLKCGAIPPLLREPGVVTRLNGLANGLDLPALVNCYDIVFKNYSLSSGQISYNPQGLLEDFIIYWQLLRNGG
jgi:DNA polymerase III subunit delta'